MIISESLGSTSVACPLRSRIQATYYYPQEYYGHDVSNFKVQESTRPVWLGHRSREETADWKSSISVTLHQKNRQNLRWVERFRRVDYRLSRRFE